MKIRFRSGDTKVVSLAEASALRDRLDILVRRECGKLKREILRECAHRHAATWMQGDDVYVSFMVGCPECQKIADRKNKE